MLGVVAGILRGTATFSCRRCLWRCWAAPCGCGRALGRQATLPNWLLGGAGCAVRAAAAQLDSRKMSENRKRAHGYMRMMHAHAGHMHVSLHQQLSACVYARARLCREWSTPPRFASVSRMEHSSAVRLTPSCHSSTPAAYYNSPATSIRRPLSLSIRPIYSCIGLFASPEAPIFLFLGQKRAKIKLKSMFRSSPRRSAPRVKC